jgi:CHASE2 domain-containing sensor protein
MLGRTPLGMACWLAISALLASNGLWHASAALRSHTYSPGIVTGIAIYVPLAVYGYSTFVGSGAVSPAIAVLAALIGASYQIWSALYHGRFHRHAIGES